MKKVIPSEIETETVASPKGDFQIQRQHVSLALGGIKDKGPWANGHPFDIELATLPPGKKNWPLHAHAAQTEFYIILSGTGLVFDSTDSPTEIGPGDHFVFCPGESHQIMNDSASDLVYYVIADQNPVDITTYPNTGKRMLKPQGECIYPTEADYYTGEE
ncbi:MAG: cupin domain-containing protein [Verrucomicrobiota bacterium]